MKALKARLSRRKLIKFSSAYYPLLVSIEGHDIKNLHWGRFIWWESSREAGEWRSWKPGIQTTPGHVSHLSKDMG